MMVSILYTEGDGVFKEGQWEKPNIDDNMIEVAAVMTGICRSDIDMMVGKFGPLPLNMQGHEGLGRVLNIGRNITDVAIGDYVATRGEPAYADLYNVRKNEYVKVPKAEPQYILEPVACGRNLITQELSIFINATGRILINGSGFLAWISYLTLREYNANVHVDVIGSSNKELWNSIGIELKSNTTDSYDIVIDLKENHDAFDGKIKLNDSAIIIAATSKKPPLTTTFEELLWKSIKIIFPSPRNKNFYRAMVESVKFAETYEKELANFWTKGYNRKNEWSNAFADGLFRSPGYNRGYIIWE